MSHVVKSFADYLLCRPEFSVPLSKVNSHIVDEQLCQSVIRQLGNLTGRTIIQLCPGAGGLSRAFLNAGARKVVAIERDRRYGEALQDLKNEASTDLFSYHIQSIYYWPYVIDRWPQHLEHVSRAPWETVHPHLLLFGMLPTRNAHHYLPNLFRQVAARVLLFGWGRVPIYLVLPERVATFLMMGPGDKRRNVISLQAQAYCDIEMLLHIPYNHVVPYSKENYILTRMVPFDPSKCLGVPYKEYEFIIRQLYVQKTRSLESAIG
jgi:16S rRNA A1518/A1519 N6-dimethyltransferase RsmA/KsgA/DIM1 with predicted DNA glycosylase/AP lyase activity